MAFVASVRHRAALGPRREHRRPGRVHGAAGHGGGQGAVQARGELKATSRQDGDLENKSN